MKLYTYTCNPTAADVLSTRCASSPIAAPGCSTICNCNLAMQHAINHPLFWVQGTPQSSERPTHELSQFRLYPGPPLNNTGAKIQHKQTLINSSDPLHTNHSHTSADQPGPGTPTATLDTPALENREISTSSAMVGPQRQALIQIPRVLLLVTCLD